MPTSCYSFPDYEKYDAVGLAELVRKREVTPLELIDAAIERIEALNPRLNAVTIKTYETAKQAAQRPLSGSPFDGVPYLAKDLASSWEGVPSTNSCRWLSEVRSHHDSELVRRTKRAGFINLGKTNVPENGWCLSTESDMWGPTINPWDATKVPGGSSGGAAVAVASGMLPMAEASDGAGSIRAPAAINGLVGLKPSRGRITFAPDAADFWFGGALFFALSRSVRDSAAMLDALAGALPGEPYAKAIPERPYALEALRGARRPLRVGFSTHNPRGDVNAPPVNQSVLHAARLAEDLGHNVEEFQFDFDFPTFWKAYTQVISVQTAAFFGFMERELAKPLRAEDFATATWTGIERGRSTTAVEYHSCIDTMQLGAKAIAKLAAPFDAIILPVLPQGTRPLGTYNMSLDIVAYNDGPLGEDNAYLGPFNISGQPAITLPLSETPVGLPIGVQIVANEGDEATLISLAADFERILPWHQRRP
ncbi:amidase [Mesorhizobium sp. B4-1-4]|uniref:amidase n=1 Tax=Mesorhizobium sp. B4-1-4 TaxID=2589888 RepID=UPI0015E41CAD|nr:amidase [Mesorhizobium sp. B4-1-4]UCI31866.1 amidase [Mesorhizobium sp. B4-1-4]